MQENKYTYSGWDGLDIYEILKTLWQARKKIVLASVIGAVIGLIIAFSMPPTYQSRVSFAPETEQNLGSGVSSIASMMGVSLDNSVDAISVEMFPDVIYSTPFVFELFSLPVETQDGLKTDFLDYVKNHQKKAWWVYVFESPFRALYWVLNLGKDTDEVGGDSKKLEIRTLPKIERDIVKYFHETATIEVNKKTGKIDLSVIMQDPKVAAMVLDGIVENLKNYMIDYRTSKERQDVENLEEICKQRKAEYYVAQRAYADFADANKNLVLLRVQAEQLKLQQEMQLAYQVYSQVATQLEGARIKEQQSKPVFFVIEPVSVPVKKHAPSKAKLFIGFAFLGAVFYSLWELWGRDYFRKFKQIFKS